MTPLQRMERRKARELMRRVLSAAPGATGLVLGASLRSASSGLRHVAEVAADEGRVTAISLVWTQLVELDGCREVRVALSVDALRGRTLAAVWALPGAPRELVAEAQARLAASRGTLIA